MKKTSHSLIDALTEKGVLLPHPESVFIAKDVDPDRISGDGVVIHAGCRIFGSRTLILPGAVIGREGPATIENCQVGPQVHLKAGSYKEAVFLEKASLGFGSRVREGTILEEQASISHTVDLKQTILFPYVTLGSLVNFCDCLMAGGTSRQNHSEVGSAYIHFNYTPNQDKATPSLLGDVAHGVMLDQPPIFLGGQGGLVGPCRLTFGTVVAAGTICRKDEHRPGRLLMGPAPRGGSVPFTAGVYRGVRRTVYNNINYIANLIALDQWYGSIRSQFISNRFPRALLEGLHEKVETAIHERLRQMESFCSKLSSSVDIYRRIAGDEASPSLIAQKLELFERWPALNEFIVSCRNSKGDAAQLDAFLEGIHHATRNGGKDYLYAIHHLSEMSRRTGSRWLQGIVDGIVSGSLKIIPAFAA